MKVTKRRKEIVNLLRASREPISGAALAEHFGVSRQIIVNDITELKKNNAPILSTHKGYALSSEHRYSSVFKVYHTDEETKDELNTIVDLGGCVVDVFIKHKAYGELRAPLFIHSRADVDAFLDQLQSGKSVLLKNVTSSYHYHTVSASSEDTLKKIELALREKSMLAMLMDYEQ